MTRPRLVLAEWKRDRLAAEVAALDDGPERDAMRRLIDDALVVPSTYVTRDAQEGRHP